VLPAGRLGGAHGAGDGNLDDRTLGIWARGLVALGIPSFGIGDGLRVVFDDGGAFEGAPASTLGLADRDADPWAGSADIADLLAGAAVNDRAALPEAAVTRLVL
jgi:hypothetical protein